MSRGQRIEFDKEQLKAALQSGLNLNDCDQEDINKLMVDYKEEVEEEFDDIDASMNIAAIGGTYKIGPLDIFCSLGNLVLLNAINSPFVTEENLQEITFNEACEAIYVICEGEEALRPIMGIKQKINDLMLLKPFCKDNPSMQTKILAKAEEISNAREQFSLNAIAFYNENFVGENFQEIVNQFVSIILDVFNSTEISEETHKSEKSAEKKS